MVVVAVVVCVCGGVCGGGNNVVSMALIVIGNMASRRGLFHFHSYT